VKLIKKIFKSVFLSIGLLLTLLILAGLAFRLFGPEPHKPLGRLVDAGGVKFHIHATGKKSTKPTLVIEGGAGSPTEYYHWLSEGLKDSLRVVRYDRTGVGYSELSDTPRDTETIANELHNLLEVAGESPPYILAGHSLGGPYIRVFTQLYPEEVVAMVLLDSTHPEQVERFNAAPKSSFRFKSVIWGLNVATFFADMGVLGLLESFIEPMFAGKGLPDEINNRTRDMLLNGKSLRAYTAEIKNYHAGLKRGQEANEFGSLPIRVFTAIEMNKESYRERGINPEKYLEELIEAQKEFTHLSSKGKQFLIDGNHQTIFTKKENADIICKEIIQLLQELEN
jgi:pimeloyl-ACP methyl ester carboxylesterase